MTGRAFAVAVALAAGSSGGCIDVLGPNASGGALEGADAGPARGGACPEPALAPGTHTRTLIHDGISRSYDLHVPPGYDPERSMPTVFYFHPLLADRAYLQWVGAIAQADVEGYLAVFADGVGASWNGGACCGPANGADGSAPVDDVGFVRALVDDVASAACVDDNRIYATGFSNGGFLSHRLACEAADLFAAIAPVSAVNGIPASQCQPARPVAVLQINGTDDALVPYEGGFTLAGVTDGTFIGAEQSATEWALRNGCTSTPMSKTTGVVTRATYSGCRDGADVELISIDGAGHCWFGELLCVLGADPRVVDATTATWAFLQEHHR